MKRLIKKWYFTLTNKTCKFRSGCNLQKKSVFEGYNVIGCNTEFTGVIGVASYIGDRCVVNGKIGKFCSIGNDVRFIVGTHPLNYVSTSPSFYSNKGQNMLSLYTSDDFEEVKLADGKYPILIENDVWIGDGASIVNGVKVHNGAVILANATVTKDVPPYAVVGGTPARILKYRFPENIIQFLLEIEWWNFSNDELVNNSHLFSDVDSFVNYYNKHE